MERSQVDSVKIYFIEPIEIISIIINTLIEIEFEAFTISLSNKDKLLKLLSNDIRNVIFFCVNKFEEVSDWLKYIDNIKKIEKSQILLGAFVYDEMDNNIRAKFLMESVPVINISAIKNDTLNTLKKILSIFEAKGRRPYITIKTLGTAESFFYISNMNEPVVGNVKNISAYAFSCEIDEKHKVLFTNGTYFKDALLVLKGARIKTDLKVIGYSKDNPNIIIIKFYTTKTISNDSKSKNTIAPEISRKLHEYIRWCLKEDINQKLDAVTA